jgi:hypothetical protein
MVSLKNFSWQKFLRTLVIMFVVTAIVACLFQLMKISDEPALTGALARRFILAAVVAFIFGMTGSVPKS